MAEILNIPITDKTLDLLAKDLRSHRRAVLLESVWFRMKALQKCKDNPALQLDLRCYLLECDIVGISYACQNFIIELGRRSESFRRMKRHVIDKTSEREKALTT